MEYSTTKNEKMKNLLTIILCCLTVGAVYGASGIPGAPNDSTKVEKQNEPDVLQVYSGYVKDTFQIKIHLPEAYSKQDTLPVVYLLDGDFFGPMLSVGLRQMNRAGKLPPLILVSVGYSSVEKMDSLRVRDYLYPATIPSDEMEAPGGGDRFLDFLEKELTPYIDKLYPSNPKTSVLMGHSFGGYFTLYSMLSYLERNSGPFSRFISASPTLWYNDFFLNQIPERVKNYEGESIILYTGVGGLENQQWSISPLVNFNAMLVDGRSPSLKTMNVVFSDLDHMDVAMVTFLKGLEYTLHENSGN
jgi:predicted alpha/beta superfamily hydrolase